MKKLNFTQPGGMPLTQEILAFMQDSYGNINNALVNLIGTPAILSGVEPITGGGWTPGLVLYDTVSNGKQILYFQGGQNGFFSLSYNNKNLVYADGLIHNVATDYYLTTSVSSSGAQISDFPRLNLTQLWDLNKTTVTNFQGDFKFFDLVIGSYNFDVINRGNICELRGMITIISGGYGQGVTKINNVIPTPYINSSTPIVFKTLRELTDTSGRDAYTVKIYDDGSLNFISDRADNNYNSTGTHYFSHTFIL